MDYKVSSPIYLIDWSNRSKDDDRIALRNAKILDSKKNTIAVYDDDRTVKLISLDKIRKRGIKIVKVALPNGRLVFMEKDNAIKKGYINE